MIKFLERNREFAIIFLVLIALGIFFVSTIPGNNIDAGGFDLSRAYHFIVFFLLNFFLLATLTGKNKIKTKHIFLSIIISIIYAVLDEIHQMFVPFRSPDIGDILIDSIGIFVSVIVYFYSKKSEKQDVF